MCIAFVLCNHVTCVVHGYYALFWSFLSCVLVGCEFGERERVSVCERRERDCVSVGCVWRPCVGLCCLWPSVCRTVLCVSNQDIIS